MDKTDYTLLEVLRKDARVPVSEIATMLGIKEAEVNKRIGKMKKSGIIKGFNTVIDWKKTAKPKVYAIIQIKIVPQVRAGFDRVCKEIAMDSRVNGIYIASGDYDAILYVAGETIDDISNFVTDKLAPKKDIVGTNTHIIMKVFKKDGFVFFDEKPKRLPVMP